MLQWLRLCTSNAGGMGSIPGQGTKIAHASQPKKKKKKMTIINVLGIEIGDGVRLKNPSSSLIVSPPFTQMGKQHRFRIILNPGSSLTDV